MYFFLNSQIELKMMNENVFVDSQSDTISDWGLVNLAILLNVLP